MGNSRIEKILSAIRNNVNPEELPTPMNRDEALIQALYKNHVAERTHWVEKAEPYVVFDSGEVKVNGTYYDDNDFYISFDAPKPTLIPHTYYRLTFLGKSYVAEYVSANSITFPVDDTGTRINFSCIQDRPYVVGPNKGDMQIPFTTKFVLECIPNDVVHKLDPKFLPKATVVNGEIVWGE